MADATHDVRNGPTSAPSPSGSVTPEEPPPPDVAATAWTKVGEGGRIVIPAEIRQLL